MVKGHKKTVAGNLREIAMRLAPGRACISVVFDHGIWKDRRGMQFIPQLKMRFSFAGHDRFSGR